MSGCMEDAGLEDDLLSPDEELRPEAVHAGRTDAESQRDCVFLRPGCQCEQLSGAATDAAAFGAGHGIP